MMGLNPTRDKLCLIQICDKDGNVCLVKIDSTRSQLISQSSSLNAPYLKKLFENSKVKKIFHFARTDLAFLYHWLGIDLINVFCTKSASKLVRTYTDKHGLKEILKELLSTEIDKSNQSTDWGAKQLTRDQLKYAGNDVFYLIPVYHKLVEMLKRENRLELVEQTNQFLPVLAKLDLLGYQDFFAH